jgi:stage III sporulation protein AE
MVVFSLLLKLTSALLEPICDSNISNFCLSISNTITYLIVSLLAVGFMFFILVVLMTLSASAFI